MNRMNWFFMLLVMASMNGILLGQENDSVDAKVQALFQQFESQNRERKFEAANATLGKESTWCPVPCWESS